MIRLICTISLLSYLLCSAQPRVEFGKQQLAAAAGKGRSFSVTITHSGPKESYILDVTGRKAVIRAADASGALYGCLDLTARIRTGGWPTSLHVSEQPGMDLRGACIGLQKPTLLPGRGPYEYPYTPENFPWFYDKALWTKYLDSMADNRLNTLYLWNGHPFASLVRLADYPYAVEVDDATFKKNEETYRWLTTEADKRGVRVIQLFYNIIVSKPFAEKNNLKTQDRNRHIIPVIADYTRKSIAAFVEKYPNVGLMFTLGEAMEGVGQDDIDWLTKTIIPGVKDGLRALGRTDEPPLVLRAHDTDGPADMAAALPLYKNLYVEAKYNGEALTTYTPHGPWAELHQKLSSVSKGLIENVHIMANLEPFRYGSPDFIQRCVQAMHIVMHASGLHLYPQASYWDWPWSADSSSPRLLEMDRDWIWYKAWARYAWNANRPRNEEIAWWSVQLAQKYGCDTAAGRHILEAYEASGEIAPKLLRRFGITDGNRQTLSLGMFMTQLIDPERYGLFTLLYESEGPPGEMLSQYAEKEWKHQPHEGETPADVIASTQEEGRLACEAIEKAAPHITANRAEFDRLRNDMLCYRALAGFYSLKANAALNVLRYKYSNDINDLGIARTLLRGSITMFQQLTDLATPAYRYANSMQTQQRKIPIRGAGGKFITWREMLPLYENELKIFTNKLDSLKKAHTANIPPPELELLQPALVKLEGTPTDYPLDSGAHPYTDTTLSIYAVAPSLREIKGISFSAAGQLGHGTALHFTCTESVDLLIGFFKEKAPSFLPPPQLETDASANDYGQAEPRINNAVVIGGMPAVNIHAWSFKPGEHTLELGKGLCLILGFVKPLEKNFHYDADRKEPGKQNLDWLFEGSGATPRSTASDSSYLRLWYRQPAQLWTEALPIGNGDLGAMIFGGVGEDHLQLNEATFWTGQPRSYQREDAHQYLDTIRQLLFTGKQAEAEALAQEHFMGRKFPDEAAYSSLKTQWFKKIRSDTSYATAAGDGWQTMTLPTPNGWETAGLEGLDGAVWFGNDFDLPAGWSGKDLAIDLGRIRDMDFTYVNGHLIGTAEGISTKRHYTIPAAFLHPGANHIAIQVLNFDDKGGFTGLKGDKQPFILYPAGPDKPLQLPAIWKYRIQDRNPPTLPVYEAEYQPFGDLYLLFAHGHPENYIRSLDLRTAISTTTYTENDIHYKREYFATVPQKAIVIHLTADRPGHVSFKAALKTPQRKFSIRRIDGHTLELLETANEGVLHGAACLHIDAIRGSVKVANDSIYVVEADEATLTLTGATSFVNYHDASANPVALAEVRSKAVQGVPWATLRAAHLREYQQQFNKFSIHLGAPSDLPTDERIVQYTVNKDPDLIALYVQYARYLLLSSSRPGAAYPANLQGLWNDELNPPWGSKYTTNINLEMNYWLAEPLNLSACSTPLFRLIKDLSQAGHATSQAYYNAPGWVLHHNTDLWCGTAPINASNHGIWPTGGAWLCHQIWEHYLFTKDRRFLAAYYPYMRSAADFFIHFLIKDPQHGWLISTPSASPEHGGLVAGPTMDHQIIRDLFRNCISAAAILHTDTVFRKTLEEKYRQIAPNQIGKYGQLQEWLEDKDDTADTHRHISHLWGVYPGTDITWKDSALMHAARQSLIYRGDEGTGWSLAWKVNCWARFREGDHALRLVNKLLSSAVGAQGEHGGVYPNLFDAHPPFQIDGNFGGAAGIAELLVQSQDTSIDILPALPAALPDGVVRGLCARGGFELDLSWSHGVLQYVRLFSRTGGPCTLQYKANTLRLSTHAGEQIRLSGELKRMP